MVLATLFVTTRTEYQEVNKTTEVLKPEELIGKHL
jgi:hypothetical protein